jgi:hypothetical protein
MYYIHDDIKGARNEPLLLLLLELEMMLRCGYASYQFDYMLWYLFNRNHVE